MKCDLAVIIKLPNHAAGDENWTHLSDTGFRTLFFSELKKIPDRFVKHVWSRALKIVTQPLEGPYGQILHILSQGVPIDMRQLEMWTTEQNGLGYGIFHLMVRNEAHHDQAYNMQVSIFDFF